MLRRKGREQRHRDAAKQIPVVGTTGGLESSVSNGASFVSSPSSSSPTVKASVKRKISSKYNECMFLRFGPAMRRCPIPSPITLTTIKNLFLNMFDLSPAILDNPSWQVLILVDGGTSWKTLDTMTMIQNQCTLLMVDTSTLGMKHMAGVSPPLSPIAPTSSPNTSSSMYNLSDVQPKCNGDLSHSRSEHQLKTVGQSRSPASPSRSPMSPSRTPAKAPASPSSTPVSPPRTPASQSKAPASPSSTPVSPSGTPVVQSKKQSSLTNTPVSPSGTPVVQSKKQSSLTSTPVSPSGTPVSQSRSKGTLTGDDESEQDKRDKEVKKKKRKEKKDDGKVKKGKSKELPSRSLAKLTSLPNASPAINSKLKATVASKAELLHKNVSQLKNELTVMKSQHLHTRAEFLSDITVIRGSIKGAISSYLSKHRVKSSYKKSFRQQRYEIEPIKQVYIHSSNEVFKELRVLQTLVEELRIDAVERRCKVKKGELEALAPSVESMITKIAQLRAEYFPLESRLKEVMEKELKVIVDEEKLTDNELGKLEDALMNCKSLAQTLKTLLQFSSIQKKRPLLVPLIRSESFQDKNALVQSLMVSVGAIFPNHDQRTKAIQNSELVWKHKRKMLNDKKEIREFEGYLQARKKALRPTNYLKAIERQKQMKLKAMYMEDKVKEVGKERIKRLVDEKRRRQSKSENQETSKQTTTEEVSSNTSTDSAVGQVSGAVEVVEGNEEAEVQLPVEDKQQLEKRNEEAEKRREERRRAREQRYLEMEESRKNKDQDENSAQNQSPKTASKLSSREERRRERERRLQEIDNQTKRSSDKQKSKDKQPPKVAAKKPRPQVNKVEQSEPRELVEQVSEVKQDMVAVVTMASESQQNVTEQKKSRASTREERRRERERKYREIEEQVKRDMAKEKRHSFRKYMGRIEEEEKEDEVMMMEIESKREYNQLRKAEEDEEMSRKEEERQRLLEDRQRREEEEQLRLDHQRKEEEQMRLDRQRKEEEQMRLDRQRKEEEQMRLDRQRKEEEQMRLDRQRKEEEQMRLEHQRKKKEEQMRLEHQRREEEEQMRLDHQRKEEEEQIRLERRRKEEEEQMKLERKRREAEQKSIVRKRREEEQMKLDRQRMEEEERMRLDQQRREDELIRLDRQRREEEDQLRMEHQRREEELKQQTERNRRIRERQLEAEELLRHQQDNDEQLKQINEARIRQLKAEKERKKAEEYRLLEEQRLVLEEKRRLIQKQIKDEQQQQHRQHQGLLSWVPPQDRSESPSTAQQRKENLWRQIQRQVQEELEEEKWQKQQHQQQHHYRHDPQHHSPIGQWASMAPLAIQASNLPKSGQKSLGHLNKIDKFSPLLTPPKSYAPPHPSSPGYTRAQHIYELPGAPLQRSNSEESLVRYKPAASSKPKSPKVFDSFGTGSTNTKQQHNSSEPATGHVFHHTYTGQTGSGSKQKQQQQSSKVSREVIAASRLQYHSVSEEPTPRDGSSGSSSSNQSTPLFQSRPLVSTGGEQNWNLPTNRTSYPVNPLRAAAIALSANQAPPGYPQFSGSAASTPGVMRHRPNSSHFDHTLYPQTNGSQSQSESQSISYV